MPTPIFEIPVALERIKPGIVAKSYLSSVPFRNFLTKPTELKGKILVKKDGVTIPLKTSLILTTDNGLSLSATNSDDLGNFRFLGGPVIIAENRFQFRVTFENDSYMIDVPQTSTGAVPDIVLEPLFPNTKTISGIIRNNDNELAARRVLAYDRLTGVLLSETTSDSVTGEYSLSVPDREITVVVQDDSASPVLNDLIARVLP